MAFDTCKTNFYSTNLVDFVTALARQYNKSRQWPYFAFQEPSKNRQGIVHGTVYGMLFPPSKMVQLERPTNLKNC